MVITSLGYRIFVRYARKPIWMPTAPSKLFRIDEKTFYTPEEVQQNKELDIAFKAQEVSIIEYMKHECYIPSTKTGGVPSEFLEKEMEDDRVIMEENDRENERIAKLKSEYFAARLKEVQEKVMGEKIRTEEMIMQTNLKVDEFIRHHKDNPDFFVTPRNIEKKIEEALENPVNFEYCIDRSGRKIGADSIKNKSDSEQ